MFYSNWRCTLVSGLFGAPVRAGFHWKLFISLGFVALLLSLAWPQQDTLAHSGVTHNALRGKPVTNWGVYGVIEVTDPDLHGGNWSYQRVATYQLQPNHYYGEIGWLKRDVDPPDSHQIVLVRQNDYGHYWYGWAFDADADNGYFAVEYDDATGRHKFFGGDSSPAAYRAQYDLNFVDDEGEGIICGGETTGVEGMGDTRCGNGGSNGLGFMDDEDGPHRNWNGHSVYREDHGYDTTFIDGNNFTSSGNE